MVECFKIEEFVVEMLRPCMPDILPGDFYSPEYHKEQERIEKKLIKTPEYIIELLEEYPETKRLVFERLNRYGVKFYRYLDMNCDVIQYIKSELPKYQPLTAEMVEQLRKMTGAGIMDCKRALKKNNNDINKAAEYIKNDWTSRFMI